MPSMKFCSEAFRRLAAVCATLSAFPVFGASLLRNADMSADDGAGYPLGWHAAVIGGGSRDGIAVVVREVADGPGGRAAKAVEVRFPKGRTFLRQRYFTLVPGETYRFGAQVRTRALGGNKVALTVWDAGWHNEVWSAPFPADTGGEWQKVEWCGAVPGVDTNGFTFAVAGQTGENPETKVEFCELFFEPVSDAARAGSRPVATSALAAIPNRIVPIWPKLSEVSVRAAEMEFYLPRIPPPGRTELRVSVDGAEKGRAALGAGRRAKVRLGDLPTGVHALAVRAVDAAGVVFAESAYRIEVRERPKAAHAAKRLNNFVDELHAGPLADGKVAFECPRDGWVWISFDRAGGNPEGRLDGEAEPVVKRRPLERRIEAMRYLAVGQHVLEVSGADGGKVRIHAVKRLVTDPWRLTGEPADLSSYRYPSIFYRRYFYGAFNTVNPRNWREKPDAQTAADEAFYADRGMRVISQVSFAPEADGRIDAAATFAKLTSPKAAADGFEMEVDENGIYVPRSLHNAYAEALWRIVSERPGQSYDTDWCDAPGKVFDDPPGQASEIAAVVNTGCGTGMLFPETYSAPLVDFAESIEKGEGHFRRFARSVTDMVPAARGSVLFFFATYIDLGVWSDYPCPETDIKYHYDHFIRTLATDGDFAEALGGIALCGTRSGEEETVRWLARCIRHYCVEGRTDSLSERYGIRHLPGIVRNCDFADGLEGWTARPADGGGVQAEKIKGYGTGIQRRKKVPEGTGDGVAVFTHSDAGPNRLEQRLSGLGPGRYYALIYCTADYDDVMKRGGDKVEEAFSSALEGATELKELAFTRHKQSSATGIGGRKIRLVIDRRVFRADAKEATLAFTDWKSPGESGAPAGTRRVLNYVVFRPYYCEGEKDIVFLRRAYSIKGGAK